MKPVYNTLYACCFLVTICFFSSLSLRAQSDSSLKKKHKRIFYFSPGISITNKHIMPVLGFTIMKRNGWGASVEVKSTIIQSEQMPKDFEFGGLLLFGGDGIPDDIYAFYILSAVKEFRTRNKQIVPGLTIGMAYTEKTIATNFTPYTATPCTSFGCSWAVDFGSSNYEYDFKKSKSAGLFLKPKLKYLFSRSVAIETAAWTILTPKGSYYGAELSLLIGRF